MSPWRAVVVVVAALAAACSGPDDTSTPTSTTTASGVTVEYKVSPIARGHLADRAHVRYRLPGGRDVEADVSLPWRSGRLRFPPDETLRLSASSENELVSLQCDAHTDQGPWGRVTGSSGTASCDFETPLPELAQR